jgi:two-component system cell cycle response regulator
MTDFVTAVATASAAAPVHLLLFDLNGFKSYNDTFGHNAGDQLLVRLSGELRSALAHDGGVYRLGGDEFCALVKGDLAQLEAVRSAARDALIEHGRGFSITASLGSASMPLESRTATNALHLADKRMYREKAGTSPVASRQTHDVLMSILTERDPVLRSHGCAVAELANAVGRRLGQSPHALRWLTSAAELHDIGKVAVPDAILNKPGPAHRRRMGVHQDPHPARRAHPRRSAGALTTGCAGALEPRALGRRRISRRALGGRYPAGVAHHLRCGRL